MLNLAFLAGLVILVLAGFHWIAEVIIASPRIHPKSMDAQFIRLLSRLLAIVAIVVVFLEGGQYLGISLATLLAGAGVGALALALSAQSVLRNLLGSLTILLEQPYRVGERIIAQGFNGIVEEVGLRSTKIRLSTDHVVSIPNGTMAGGEIENIGRRARIRRSTELRLPLNTSAEKAGRAVEIIRGILEDHEGMSPDFPPSVYLSEFNPDSMSVKVTYWFHPPNYDEFMKLSHKVNLRIKRELEAADIELAYPIATASLGRSTALQ